MNTPLQLVSDPRRQEILRLLWDGERCAGEIAAEVDVSFSAVSQHLSKLLEAQVVNVRKEGRMRFYRVDKQALGPLADYLESFWRDRLLRLENLAEQAEHETENGR